MGVNIYHCREYCNRHLFRRCEGRSFFSIFVPMIPKIFRLTLFLAAVLAAAQDASAKFPVRLWDDDMARHTFSLGVGPGWSSKNNPFAGTAGLSTDEISPLGVQTALRYDWSYFRGYEVALGTGATYIFSAKSSRLDGGAEYRGGVKLGETFHYIGVNAVNTKMWFGKRTIWDVCIHMGYMGGSSWMKAEGDRQRVAQNGFMAGISTGLDVLITAWLGVGVRLNAMTGVMYPSGSSASRDYSCASLMFGAVYCF